MTLKTSFRIILKRPKLIDDLGRDLRVVGHFLRMRRIIQFFLDHFFAPFVVAAAHKFGPILNSQEKTLPTFDYFGIITQCTLLIRTSKRTDVCVCVTRCVAHAHQNLLRN